MIGYATMPHLDVLTQWSAITGYEQTSAEWSEVIEALAEAGLLGADPQQHDLFPHPRDAERARRVWLAVIAGAHYQRGMPDYHPATNTAIVAALLDSFYSRLGPDDPFRLPECTLDLAVTMLRGDLPRRVVRVTDTLEGAFQALVGDVHRYADDGGGHIPTAISMVLAMCAQDCHIAERGARAMAQTLHMAICPVGQGQWLTYYASPYAYASGATRE